MPTYGYQCGRCAHKFEVRQSMSDAPLKDCPECGGELRKLLYPVGVQFKGSGFYTTDYGRQSNGDGNGEGKSDVKSDVKSDAKTEGSKTSATGSDKGSVSGSSSSSNGSESGTSSSGSSEKKKEPAGNKE
jgi:putative FmdB family regulatory protein